MSNFQKMHNLPDFVSITLYGQTFTALVVPYVDKNFRQVRFNMCAVDGSKTQKIRFSEKITAFENTLKESYPNEWAAFHKG
jgi:hypothetical protein